MKYTKEELEFAKIQLTSLLNKCKKSMETVKEDTSQASLLKNRIQALEIALILLEEKA